MNIVDIILLICFIPALIQGFRKGFISQIIGIVSIIAGSLISFKGASALGEWMAQYFTASEQTLKLVSFAIIFIGVFIALALLGRIIEGLFKLILLGWLNRLLGIVFSLLKTGLLIGLVIMIFCSLNNTFEFVSTEVLEESLLFPPIKNSAYYVFPYLKEFLFWNK